MKNYYRILGVPAYVDAAGLKEAHRKAAMATHPDQTGRQDSSPFTEVQQAYETLSDPKRRADYEQAYVDAAATLGYVVCPACFAQNRVPRFGKQSMPRCGACKALIQMSPSERDTRIRDAVAERTAELVETLGTEGASLAKDAVKSAADWTRRKLGITRTKG